MSPLGASRFFAIRCGDKVVSRGFTLALLALSTLVGALGFLVLALPLVLVATKDATYCLLASGIVIDDVHQLIGSGGGVAAQLLGQLFASGSREKSHDDVRVGDVGKLGALCRETPFIIAEGLVWLLFTTPEILRVTRAHVTPLEVPFEHPLEVVLVVDLSRWEILEPRSSGI
jgi:hypothetical protein